MRSPVHYILLAIFFALSWLSYHHPLALDEFGTWWVVRDSYELMVARTFSIQGQTPLYYTAVWLIKEISGVSSFSLRLLSILSFLSVIYLTFRLWPPSFGNKAKYFTLVALIANPYFWYEALNARPYFIAAAFIYAGVLLTLSNERSPLRFLSGALCVLIAFYLHYIYITGFLCIGIIILLQRCQVIKRLIILTVLFFVGIITCWEHLTFLSSVAEFKDYLEKPGTSILFSYLFHTKEFPFILFFLTSTVIIHSVITKGEFKFDKPIKFELKRDIWIIVVSWVLPIIFLFALAKIFKGSLYQERYLIHTHFFFCLLLALALSFMVKGIIRELLLFFVILIIIAYQVILPRAEAKWEKYSKSLITSDYEKNDSCLLVWSGFVESSSELWVENKAFNGYFISPVSYYLGSEIEQTTIILPAFLATLWQQKYLDRVISQIEQSGCHPYLIERYNSIVGKEIKKQLSIRGISYKLIN